MADLYQAGVAVAQGFVEPGTEVVRQDGEAVGEPLPAAVEGADQDHSLLNPKKTSSVKLLAITLH